MRVCLNHPPRTSFVSNAGKLASGRPARTFSSSSMSSVFLARLFAELFEGRRQPMILGRPSGQPWRSQMKYARSRMASSLFGSDSGIRRFPAWGRSPSIRRQLILWISPGSLSTRQRPQYDNAPPSGHRERRHSWSGAACVSAAVEVKTLTRTRLPCYRQRPVLSASPAPF